MAYIVMAYISHTVQKTRNGYLVLIEVGFKRKFSRKFVTEAHVTNTHEPNLIRRIFTHGVLHCRAQREIQRTMLHECKCLDSHFWACTPAHLTAYVYTTEYIQDSAPSQKKI